LGADPWGKPHAGMRFLRECSFLRDLPAGHEEFPRDPQERHEEFLRGMGRMSAWGPQEIPGEPHAHHARHVPHARHAGQGILGKPMRGTGNTSLLMGVSWEDAGLACSEDAEQQPEGPASGSGRADVRM
jgi:hypothetical protein